MGMPANRHSTTSHSLSLMAYSKIVELRNNLKELAQATKIAQMQGDSTVTDAFVETCSYFDANDLVTLLTSDLQLFRVAQEILQQRDEEKFDMNDEVGTQMPNVDFEKVLFSSIPEGRFNSSRLNNIDRLHLNQIKASRSPNGVEGLQFTKLAEQ